jgi:uncharacterized protein YukJ
VTIPRYGVLKARPIGLSRGSTHLHVRCVANGAHHRVSINVHSQQPPSELRYIVLRPFAHLMLDGLDALPPGYTAVPSRAGTLALDLVRAPLFERRRMKLLPANLPGPSNDLADLIGGLVQRAINERDAHLYAFGTRWGPERRTPDRVFGFTPGNGIHNVHMNQGNHPRFADDDGVWQDGALLLQLTTSPEWVGVCLAFQSQTWRTDDRTGHPMRQTRVRA